jgi:hypothetical protein
VWLLMRGINASTWPKEFASREIFFGAFTDAF